MTSVGRTLRRERIDAGLTQGELGAGCGLSQRQVSRFELGQRIPEQREIRLMARALDIDPAVLSPGSSGAARDAATPGSGESEGDVRRRALLAAGLGMGGGAAGFAGAPAVGSAWDKALFTSGTSTLSAAQLDAGLGAVAHDLAAARYDEAGRALPRLIAAAKSNATRSGKRGAELLTRAWVLATAYSVKERHPDAWSTSAWAVDAARQAQHPLAHVMATRAQYICLRQNGQHQQARMVAEAGLHDLDGDERARPVLGHLLLEAAYGAAQAGRSTDAEALWEHGRSMAMRGPAVSAWPDHPGPLTAEQVERYGLCIHHVLGNTRRANAHMAALNANTVRTPHTAARIRHDSAKLCRDNGDMPEALRLLQELEDETPQDARRSSVRGMVVGMLQTSPALEGLRPFAAKVGAI
ncbi:hypothetical protein AN219_38025 [Streptomyces nanshensis]|nr:hypothetical protein AN219_38025 [Streptomyces nanshensis]